MIAAALWAVNAPACTSMTRKTKDLIVVLAGATALLAATPWLFPLSRLIPTLEAKASEYLGEPVHIGSLQLFLLPLPHVTLNGISAGRTPALHIEQISVTPVLAHVFSAQQAVEIRVSRAVAQQQALDKVFAKQRAKKPGAVSSPAKVRVERVVFEDAELRLPGATLKDLDVRAELAHDGAVREIRASSEGGRLVVLARPGGAGALRVQIAARAWRPPAGPPVEFDRIDATALLTQRGIESRDFTAHLYGGRATGVLSVVWKAGWTITGELSVEQVEVERLVAMFAEEVAVSGRLTAQPRFAMRAARPAHLVAALHLASDFVIEQGLLHKVDLLAAASKPLSREAARSGTTRFDELSGHLAVDGEGYHFSRLRVASGLLTGSGEVSVLRNERLEGRVDAELKATGSLITVPLRVGGTVRDPSVLPTKTAMVGAVAGSVLLPGVGTAVGLKASQLTEKLFGRKRRRASELTEPPAMGTPPTPAPRR
jgi:uncharacterized protein involved in outer membrane biogenesis